MNSNPQPLALARAPGEQPDRRTLAHECKHPACATITLRDFCAKHRHLARAQPALEEQRHGLSVTADQVLTIYQIEKRRKRAAAPEEVTA